MGINLPQARLSGAPQLKKRQIPLEAILEAEGNNPIANSLNQLGPLLSQALMRRAELKRQAALTAEESGFKKRDEARKNTELGLKVLQSQNGYASRDETGKVTEYPGLQGIKLNTDPAGMVSLDTTGFKPGLKPIGGGSGGRSSMPKNAGVTPEGKTVVFDPIRRTNMVDGQEYTGQILPTTAGAEEQRRMGFAKIGRESVQEVKNLLKTSPGAFAEVKAIQYSPGNVYRQLSSPSAKLMFTNIKNAIQAEVYTTTGAAMNENEAEEKALMFMVALNDTPQDALNKLAIVERNLNSFTPRNQGLQTLPLPGQSAPATHRWNPATGKVEAIQ